MNDKPHELTVVSGENSELERLAENPALMAAGMYQAVMKAGVTPETALVAEKMVGLMERMDARRAEREYNAAFAKLQQNMPKITALKAIPDKHGNTKYKYAPFEDIMEQVQPLLNQFGFSISFDPCVDGDRIGQAVILRHAGGHKEISKPFFARAGSGPVNSSAAQADGAASTYAKRFALCGALNIIIEQDTDARIVGQHIGESDANKLQLRVKACGADELAFLEFAQSPVSDSATPEEVRAAYQRIGSAQMPGIEAMLRKKEAKQQRPA